MNHAVAWSYELLDPVERTMFQQFAVFAGGTDLAGVLEVCALAPTDGGDSRSRTLAVLDGLVSRSLIAVDRTASGMRYRMLVPVQTFARRMLEESGDDELIRRRHVAHVIGALTENATVLESNDPRPGFVALDNAAPNIRAAYRWCRDVGDDALATEIVSSFGIFAFRGQTSLPELLTWVADSLSTADIDPIVRLRVLLAAALYLDQPPQVTIEQAEEAIQLAIALDLIEAHVAGLVALGHAIGEVDTSAAIEVQLDAVRVAHAAKPVYLAVALDYAANQLLRVERRAEVDRMLADGLSLGIRRFGLFGPEIAYQRGRSAMQGGEHLEARRWFEEAESIALQIGSAGGRANAAFGIAGVALAEGDYANAVELFSQSLELDRLIDPRELWADRLNLSVAAARLGRVDIVEAQLEAFEPSERPLLAGVQSTIAALLADLNGSPEVSTTNFLRAVRCFADMDSRTHLRMALSEWARCSTGSNAAFAQSLDDVCTRLRSGALDSGAAMAIVEEALVSAMS